MSESLTIENVHNYKKELLECIKKDAVSQGEDVTLSSGKKSNLYVDSKMVTLSPKGAFLTGMVLTDALKDVDFDAIGGMTIGADPIVGAFAAISYNTSNRDKSTFIIRKEPKKHGKQKYIEGPLKPKSKVVIIDDVTTTGESILKSINVIKNNTDCKIVKIISLVDRLEGASEALKEKGYVLESIFTKHDLLSQSETVGNNESTRTIKALN
jgi:orotate phosphoribosyltransferase